MTTRPRLLFIAKPQPKVLSAMEAAVSTCGLDVLLGAALFAPENWHQSLSASYQRDTDADIERFLRAGSRITATAVTLRLNRARSQGTRAGQIHWAILAQGSPAGFRELVCAVQAALRAEGIDEYFVHRPHLTISYRAPTRLPLQKIAPIDWTIDAVLLVEGSGQPYRYTTLAQWPLAPVPVMQLPLF